MVHESKGVERDAGLRDQSEEGVRRIAEEGGGEQPPGGGDQRRGRPLSRLRRDEPLLERRGEREGERGGGIQVDVDIEEVAVAGEELLPEGGEDEVGIGEE